MRMPDQNSNDNLLVLLTAAGCNYFMGIPCADDVMLNFQTTSYHDIMGMRKLFGLSPAPEFARWLEEHGISWNGDRVALPERRDSFLSRVSGLLEAAR